MIYNIGMISYRFLIIIVWSTSCILKYQDYFGHFHGISDPDNWCLTYYTRDPWTQKSICEVYDLRGKLSGPWIPVILPAILWIHCDHTVLEECKIFRMILYQYHMICYIFCEVLNNEVINRSIACYNNCVLSSC